MNTFKYKPEGWDNKISVLNKNNINEYIEKKEILQGLVKKCDDRYNLYINLGNEITGIMPRSEIECINTEINGLPKEELCTGKVHKFVQFKVKEKLNENEVILSRKEVQLDAINSVKNELQEGQIVSGIVKNIKPYGAFIEIGGGFVGMAHIEDLSVARIKSPSERLKIGQKLNIMVKRIDKEKGKTVDLAGFGKFEITERKAREGFNPLTKEKIQIEASKSVKFKVYLGDCPSYGDCHKYCHIDNI